MASSKDNTLSPLHSSLWKGILPPPLSVSEPSRTERRKSKREGSVVSASAEEDFDLTQVRRQQKEVVFKYLSRSAVEKGEGGQSDAAYV